LLTACMRHPSIVEVFLRDGLLLELIGGAQSSSFEVASETFAILAEILLNSAADAAPYIKDNFQEFFKSYTILLRTKDYVTLRRSLGLLADMLFEPAFQEVMIKYVANADFLQIHMNLLRDDSKTIQYEAFRVFSIFVANPRKPAKVHHILFRNKEKLTKFLPRFLSTSRADDDVFLADRQTVIEKLNGLDSPGAS